MRLFVAVDPPADAAQHLHAALTPVRETWPALRWAEPATWHLTLAFCGEVDERAADDLGTRLVRAAHRQGPLTLRLARGGAFPRPARAGVLWIGLAGDVQPLVRLAASTTAAARRSGIDVDERRFRPHLTVARVNPAEDLRGAVAALDDYTGPDWTASEMHLVRSHLGPHVVHERVATYALGV